LDIFELIKQRRSIRAYTNKDVPDEIVEQLIDAATWAPSAGNVQPWEFVVVKDTETKNRLFQAAGNQKSVVSAPVVIVVCADLNRAKQIYGSRGENLYCIQDTAAATQNILLVAHELGLSTCWIGAFEEKAVAKVINAPKNVRPLVMIPVGYGAQTGRVRSQRPINEVVHHEKF
jgi:nitroreductase